MENMKRALSAFLAFVLVLGMVPAIPMFASAEEVETQPETIAVETTEAETEGTEVPETTVVTVPETTAPAQTEAEETVPETTAAQETQPEQTEPAETVPEETVSEETVPEETVPAETVPEETVPGETVPEETLEEVEATEEAMNAEIPEEDVQGIAVTADKQITYVGDSIKLTAVVTPETAVNRDVVYTVLDAVEGVEDYVPAPYDADDLAQGIVTATAAGKLAIVWKSAEVEEGVAPFDPFEEDEELQPLWLEFVDYRMEINETAIPKDNRIDGGGYKIFMGSSMPVSAHYIQQAAGADEEVIVPLHTAAVEWTLAEGDEQYAALTVSEDTKEVFVKALTVSESRKITLYAKDDALVGDLAEEKITDSLEIWILPQPYKVSIRTPDLETEDGEMILGGEINDETIILNINDYLHPEDPEQPPSTDWIDIRLDADVLPEEAKQPMLWSVSDKGSRVIHETKISEDPVKYDTTEGLLRMPLSSGKTVLTVASEADSSIKASVTFVRKSLLKAIAFTEKTNSLEELISGSSFQMQAVQVLRDGSLDKKSLDSKVVRWELSEEDKEYATLAANGKLTAKKNLVRGKTITVICSVIDNEKNTRIEKTVNIRPRATSVDVFFGDGEKPVNSQTLLIDTTEAAGILPLSATVYPVAEQDDAVNLGAKADVVWTSSNNKIATVDKLTGEVDWKDRKGTVTITATANDGSGKKAYVKLQFGDKIQNIYIDAPYRLSEDGPETEFILKSGKSWNLGVVFTPKTPTNKNLTWTLVGEDDAKYATISSSGRLSAKTVYESHKVTVRATAKDGTGLYDEVEVMIQPKVYNQLSIRATTQPGTMVGELNSEPVTATTVLVPVGESLDLEAFSDGSMEPVGWGPSKNSVVDVYEDGFGAATVTVKKTGSATITATATDGSKRKATFVVKGVQLAEGVQWTHTHNQANLASGKSMTLKAKAFYWENSKRKTPSVTKLVWSVEPGGEKYATVNSNGKVTAIAGYKGDPVDVTIRVDTTDGSGEYGTWSISVAPAPESVRIYRDSKYATTYTMPMMTPGVDTVELEAKTIPENDRIVFTWKSSNSSVASVVDGTVTCKKSGTVTITATANDGSGKSASFKLKIVAVAPDNDHIAMEGWKEDATWYTIAGGRNLSLKGIAWDGNGNVIKGKKFTWTLSDYEDDTENGTAFASISGSTLRTKKVTSPKRVVLTMKTKEDNKDWVVEKQIHVVIRPATTAVRIVNEQGVDISSKLGYVGDTVDLYAMAKPNSDACQVFAWKSSNTKIADFDDSGNLVCKKAGTVTITATAIDGTGKKDTVKLTVW